VLASCGFRYRTNWFIVCTAAPKFVGELKDTVTLNVGASHVLELPFTANPTPKATWTFNDADLPDAKRFKSTTIIGMTSLTMAKVVLKDAGNYKVTLENENGQVSLTVKLIVLGMLNPLIQIWLLFGQSVLQSTNSYWCIFHLEFSLNVVVSSK